MNLIQGAHTLRVNGFYRSCLGFGSGVLTESFERVLFFALQFWFLAGLAVGLGNRVVLASGLTGLGWALLGLGWAELHTFLSVPFLRVQGSGFRVKDGQGLE